MPRVRIAKETHRTFQQVGGALHPYRTIPCNRFWRNYAALIVKELIKSAVADFGIAEMSGEEMLFLGPVARPRFNERSRRNVEIKLVPHFAEYSPAKFAISNAVRHKSSPETATIRGNAEDQDQDPAQAI